MRLNSRSALLCHEYLHKKFAPNRFDLSEINEVSLFAEELARLGDLYEQQVFQLIEVTFTGVVRIDVNASDEERQHQTVDAIFNPTAQIILGAEINEIAENEILSRLGIDRGRSKFASKPDILIRATGETSSPIWLPVDVKSHKSFDPENKSNFISLTDFPKLDPYSGKSVNGKMSKDDFYQLAHYTRHLEYLGIASSDSWAGIIGREPRQIAWSKLKTVQNGAGKSATNQYADYVSDANTALEIAESSERQNLDPKVNVDAEPEYEPNGKFGCKMCPYYNACIDAMESYDNGSGHVTLLASITPRIVQSKLNGVKSIRELEALPPSNPKIGEAQLRARVRKTGIPELIDPSNPLDLPTFDIEIDIDLENSQAVLQEFGIDEEFGDDRVYLYGFGIHDRTINPDWRSAKFDHIKDFTESENGGGLVLLQMWQRLNEEVIKAERAGKTIGIFHYSPHEKTWFANLSSRFPDLPGIPSEADVQVFAAKYLVDLLPYAKKISFPTKDYSIKSLAPHAGFKWGVDDAGGANSMLKYKEAIDQSSKDEERNEACNWLISYNLDDVRATFAVRDYVRGLTFL